MLLPKDQCFLNTPASDRSIGCKDRYQLVGYSDDLGAYINDIIVFRKYTVNELKKCI